MVKTLLPIALLLSLVPAGLHAADLYAGAGLGGTVEAGTFRDSLGRSTEAGGDPWKLFGGARFGRHLAVEVATQELGTQRCCSGIADLGFASEVGAYAVAALGRWPLGRFAPFFKVGALLWEEDGEFITLSGPTRRSEDGTDLLIGAGVDMELPGRFGLRADWERYEFGATTSDSLWASVLWRF